MQNERMNRKKTIHRANSERKKKELMNQISFSFHGCIELAMHFFSVLIRQRVAANFVYLTVQ